MGDYHTRRFVKYDVVSSCIIYQLRLLPRVFALYQSISAARSVNFVITRMILTLIALLLIITIINNC